MLDLASRRYVFMSHRIHADEIYNIISEQEAYKRVHPDDREVSVNQQKQFAAGHDLPEPRCGNEASGCRRGRRGS